MITHPQTSETTMKNILSGWKHWRCDYAQYCCLAVFMQTISLPRSLSKCSGQMINLRLLIPGECGRDWKRERREERGREDPVFWLVPHCSSRLRSFIQDKDEGEQFGSSIHPSTVQTPDSTPSYFIFSSFFPHFTPLSPPPLPVLCLNYLWIFNKRPSLPQQGGTQRDKKGEVKLINYLLL